MPPARAPRADAIVPATVSLAPLDPIGAFDGRVFVHNTVLFTRALRAAGLPTDLAGALDFARALALVDLAERDQVRAAGAAIFCRRRADIEPYDSVFDAFWRRHAVSIRPPGLAEAGQAQDGGREAAGAEGGSRGGPVEPVITDRPVRAEPGGEAAAEPERGPRWVVSPRSFSVEEALRHRAFGRMSPGELRDAERLIDGLRPVLATRRTRRYKTGRRGRAPAPRAMLRRNLANGGDLLTWTWRRRVRRPRSIVLVCDVSGSMDIHARLLVRFAQALARTAGVRTEAFVFGTRLTRITREVRGRDPDAALRKVGAAVSDWAGGTRIGDSLREFNLRWARRVLRSSAVVLVVSDGWDRGDPALVGSEVARLQRSCHRLIWLNPLSGADAPVPATAAMAAALPYVDDYLPARDLASLTRLGELLGGLGLGSAGRPPRTGRPATWPVEGEPRSGHPRRARRAPGGSPRSAAPRVAVAPGMVGVGEPPAGEPRRLPRGRGEDERR
ncbi:MAG: domain containing CoxE-like protein [Chloroflexi bacterium]|nr:domain containing CoxE-like protein [Chloroflexota bacterium]